MAAPEGVTAVAGGRDGRGRTLAYFVRLPYNPRVVQAVAAEDAASRRISANVEVHRSAQWGTSGGPKEIRTSRRRRTVFIQRLFSRAACVGLLLAVTVTGASAANLVTNPGFETGDLTGWQVFGLSGLSSVTVQSPDNGPSAPGTHNAFMDNRAEALGLTLKQSTAPGSATAGMVYYSFDLKLGQAANGGVFFVQVFAEQAGAASSALPGCWATTPRRAGPRSRGRSWRLRTRTSSPSSSWQTRAPLPAACPPCTWTTWTCTRIRWSPWSPRTGAASRPCSSSLHRLSAKKRPPAPVRRWSLSFGGHRTREGGCPYRSNTSLWLTERPPDTSL